MVRFANGRNCEVGTGFEPVYTALQAVASPLGHPTVKLNGVLRAVDEIRTRDIHLGKVVLYQLSYNRRSYISQAVAFPLRCSVLLR